VLDEGRIDNAALFALACALAGLKVSCSVIDGGNVINDAMLSGPSDVAPIGVPGFRIARGPRAAQQRTRPY
jgi:hypothetical protein